MSGKDVPSATCFPKRILQMETSHQKPQANTEERANNQRNPPHFLKIALFIRKSESNVCLMAKRKANLTKTVAKIMKEQGL